MMIPVNKNRGSVLIISLLILLVLTMLGVTALDSTIMEERMSSNTRQRNLALQAAEAALKAGEQWLSNNAGNVMSPVHISKFTGTAELYNDMISARALTWDFNDTSYWAAGNSTAVTTLSSFPTDPSVIPGAPRYVIEYVGRGAGKALDPLNFTDPDLRAYVFRIIAIGWGPDKSTKVVLSSTFSKQLS